MFSGMAPRCLTAPTQAFGSHTEMLSGRPVLGELVPGWMILEFLWSVKAAGFIYPYLDVCLRSSALLHMGPHSFA